LAAQLAWHFESAGLTEKAIACYRQAARHAVRVAADREGLDLLRSGLGLVTRLPAGDDRERCELNLQLEIGLTLIALHGYAASEVNDGLARIRELHRRTGEHQPLFMVLWQYTMFAGLRADYGRAIDAAEEMMALADRSEDPDAAAVASLARGWLVLMVGRTGDGMADLDRVARLIARQQGAIVLLRRATSTLSELDTKTCRRARGVRMKMADPL
jgi:hypothetical protein